MRRILPIVALLTGTLLVASCNKGDDNPYGDWKCTCFVSKMDYWTAGDTVRTARLDTVYLMANDMDKNTAKSFCDQAKTSYVDTFGSTATCNIK
ncbi:MAG: hypothetical protein JNM41_13680 [Flavipsychrobacter sp.]|nr:hypothetical protein [Flavipsychrobacter sp.]